MHPGLPELEGLPEPLRLPAARRWEAIEQRIEPSVIEKIPQTLRASLPLILSSSPFVAETLQKKPEVLDELLESKGLESARTLSDFKAGFARFSEAIEDEETLHRQLRRYRNLEMVRIAWRDIAGWATVEETLKDLSMLAEALLDAALSLLFQRACARSGTPRNREGEAQNLIVLGMGKLGGGELNFSSDIDLIFAYRDDGELDDRKGTSYGEFYTRLARSLIRALDLPTEDGFVFRVDTRLRPFGDSGPLVLHFEALERYYESQAREWERYAMIKARVMAGDPRGGRELERFLQPFVYRRYLDFRALGELRDLKRMIQKEVTRKGGQANVKLGKGGIREIEFIGQAFQLIRGGSEKSLQSRSILKVLDALKMLELLPAPIVEQLQDGYRSLRRIENRLQQYRDQQTHTLPDQEIEKSALSHALGFSSWEAFSTHLSRIQSEVHAIFEDVIRLDQEEDTSKFPMEGGLAELERFLSDLGLANASSLAPILLNFRESGKILKLSARGTRELERLLPPLIRDIGATQDPETVLTRILEILKAIAGRNVYLTLIAENPGARSRLVRLVAASPWFATTLSKFPILLDELLDHRNPEAPFDVSSMATELSRKIEALEPDDLEAFMVVLRQFHQATVLRIAARDITGHLPLPEVSNALTHLAELLIQASLDRAFLLTRERHGVPPGCPKDHPAGFAIIAYGKLGGLELGYGSDLDLVFLYEGEAEAETSGKKPITTAEYYARIAQRVLHILGTNTPSGILYETDLRLRPSGNSGLLVSSLRAFEAYQMESAWTWEQQALVKARFVAGDSSVGQRFSAIRARSLGRGRDVRELGREVLEMRVKMREALGSHEPGCFDLKQDPGGIVDIEFLVQFWVLAESHTHPQLAEWTDVLRLLQGLSEQHRITTEEGRFLRESYFALRKEAHRAQLDERKASVEATRFEALRQGVCAIWQHHLGCYGPAEPDLSQTPS